MPCGDAALVPEKGGADCHSVPSSLVPRPQTKADMAKSVQGKQKEGLRPRGFSIPSVEDIRQANKVSAGKRPTLFKSTTSAAASSSQDIKEKQQTSTAAVERTKDRPVSDTAPVQENLATFPRPGSHGANRHLSRNCLKEKSKTVPSHSEHTESKSATTGVANQLDNDVQSRGGGGSVQLLESAPESATVSIAEASSTAGTIVTAATHHQPHAIITNPIQVWTIFMYVPIQSLVSKLDTSLIPKSCGNEIGLIQEFTSSISIEVDQWRRNGGS